MATNTPSKLALGQLILAALLTVTSKLTKAARDVFTSAYRALVDAEQAVKVAERGVTAAVASVQAADEAQDRATMGLAAKLIGDGFSKGNPFETFGGVNPSKLVKLGHLEEANALMLIAARVIAHAEISPATKKAAAAVDRAATLMKAADSERRQAFEARAAAIGFRDRGLPEAYALALANLRASIKYADIADNTTRYRDVFGALPKAKRKKKTPTPVG